MKLFEQDWSKINLDDIPEDGTVVVKKIVKPKVDNGTGTGTIIPPKKLIQRYHQHQIRI